MGLFKNKEVEEKDKSSYEAFVEFILGKDGEVNYLYDVAEAHAIDIIARIIAGCELQVFENNGKIVKEVKNNLYWSLNVSPNENENGTSFLYKLMVKLLINRKALILVNGIRDNISLYVAKDFDTTNTILKAKIFKNIQLEDDENNLITLKQEYTIDNCIYFSLKNKFITTANSNFSKNLKTIMFAAQKAFTVNNFPKWRLKNSGGQPTIMDFKTKKPIEYDKYIEKITKGLLDEKESVVLLSEIFDLINLNEKTTKNFEDFSKIFKTISDTVAQKWNIPLDIFYGTKTEKSNGINDLVTLSLKLYFEMLEDGFNKTLVGKKSYLNGEYIKFNILSISHKDLIDKASGWDKLISNGFSFNQLSKFLGLPTINKKWANKHYITKNYANVEGGEEEDGN